MYHRSEKSVYPPLCLLVGVVKLPVDGGCGVRGLAVGLNVVAPIDTRLALTVRELDLPAGMYRLAT